MLKIVRISLSVIIVALGIYMFMTKNVEFVNYNLFLISVLMLVMGADAFKRGRKGNGYISIAAAVFGFFVTFQGFFLD